MQGGYLALFVDEMFSTAIGSVLEEGEWAVTAEVKLSFLRALRPGAIEGFASVVRRTRSLAFLEGRCPRTKRRTGRAGEFDLGYLAGLIRFRAVGVPASDREI